jgi:hypothetical protein
MAARSTRIIRRLLVVSSVLALAACGSGSETSTTVDPTTTSNPTSTAPSASTSTTSGPTTTAFVPTLPPDFPDFPADYQPPSGWLEVDDTTVDIRLDGFRFLQAGCCEAGLQADFGSPDLPTGSSWDALGDGLYYASLADWDPNRPDVIHMRIGRLVECASPEGQGAEYCDGEPGRFEWLTPFQEFEVPLGDFLTVQMLSYVEPSAEDEANGFLLSPVLHIGQGPDFAALLNALHDDYTRFIADPTAAGASIVELAAILDDSPFRYVGAWNGAWSRPNFPPISYAVRHLDQFDSDSPFTAIPTCYPDDEIPTCLDNVGGDPLGTAAKFEELIRAGGSLHVREGRWAFFFPGIYTAAG